MPRTLLTAIVALISLTGVALPSDTLYVKEVVFPPHATAQQKATMAAHVVPSPTQRMWHDLGLTAFLHFGPNTFTDREWGDGTEDPTLFCPTDLDTDQWVRTLRDAGFRLVMLTAKHHDGFCLWPTATTAHSVKSSPWQQGRGDVVKSLRKSCDKYGMKLGLYLSPWDRNTPCYGNSERYNDMFVAQLTELLTQYGRIDEVWFDGACGEGPNGKKQQYDWKRFRDTITTLMPDAVMAITGDDVRWVGNENGTGRQREWSVTAVTPKIFAYADSLNNALGIGEMSADLGSRTLLERAPGVRWWPSEVDVSIRPGWFYHDYQQPKSLFDLANIYLTSIGRNSVLLLNVPPDRRGLIAHADSVRLQEFGQWIRQNFTRPVASACPRCHPHTMATACAQPINAVWLSEDIDRGQRVESFEIQALCHNQWQRVARGTTIGHSRIVTFPDVMSDSLRLQITQTRALPHIARFEAYHITLPAEETVRRAAMPVDTHTWRAVSIDGRKCKASALNQAFDADPTTVWQWDDKPGHHSIVVYMGTASEICAFVYYPNTTQPDLAGTLFTYSIEFSNDGKEWFGWKSGEFSNIVNNPIPQEIYLPTPVTARYFRFSGRSEIDGRHHMAIPDLQMLTPKGAV